MRLHSLFLLAFASSLFCLSVSAQEEKKEEPPRDKPKKERRDPGEGEKKDDTRRPEAESSGNSRTPASAKRTWLGIATAPIDQALREHLELPEGFGVQVMEIVPDSLAVAAGLKSNDIITHLENQHLISPEHLSLLVRTKSSGDKTSLTIIRKGKEEVIELTLGETDEAAFTGHHSPGHDFPPPPNPNDPRWKESMQRQQDYWQDWMNKNRPEWRGNPSRKEGPQTGDGADKKPGETDQPKDPADSRPADGRPPSVSVNPGFPLRVFGSEGVLKIDNEKGELTLTRKDGAYTLEIKNADGKVIFTGSFDPARGIEGLPEAAREQLEIMKLGNFEIHLPDAPVKDPEKANSPRDMKEGGRPAGGIL